MFFDPALRETDRGAMKPLFHVPTIDEVNRHDGRHPFGVESKEPPDEDDPRYRDTIYLVVPDIREEDGSPGPMCPIELLGAEWYFDDRMEAYTHRNGLRGSDVWPLNGRAAHVLAATGAVRRRTGQ